MTPKLSMPDIFDNRRANNWRLMLAIGAAGCSEPPQVAS
jgi:hypothetical protein